MKVIIEAKNQINLHYNDDNSFLTFTHDSSYSNSEIKFKINYSLT